MTNDRNDMSPKTESLLLTSEQRWVSIQPLLESLGYMLRPRYRPGWTPSWFKSNRFPIECEDGIFSTVNTLAVLDSYS